MSTITRVSELDRIDFTTCGKHKYRLYIESEGCLNMQDVTRHLAANFWGPGNGFTLCEPVPKTIMDREHANKVWAIGVLRDALRAHSDDWLLKGGGTILRALAILQLQALGERTVDL